MHGIEQTPPIEAAIVENAIIGRHSVRRFLPTPVPRALVERLLGVAARAPSGTNMQPWQVTVVAGEAKDRLSAAILAARDDPTAEHKQEYRYYPDAFFEPYQSRRRKVGWDLYGLLGIARGEREKAHAQHGRNFLFFDAPLGMIFTIDRRLEIGSWLDYGMFLQSLMIAARGHGLDSCPQAAFAGYHRIIRAELGIPEEQMVICGMSIGYAAPEAPENRLVTERAPLADFVRFHGL